MRITHSIQKTSILIILSLLLIIAGVYFASFLPDADWLKIYYPTAHRFLAGLSPYDKLYPDCGYCVFVNPPWTLFITIPLSILPPHFSRGLLFIISVISIIFFGWKVKAKPLTIAFILLSPTVIGSLLAGNLDLLLLPAFFLPAPFALLILMIKPQIGLGLAIYYLITLLFGRDWKAFIFAFAPVSLAFLVSAFFFPGWVRIITDMPANPWNRSIFPYGIPIALFLMIISVKDRNKLLSIGVSPFLSPYLTFYSYSVFQFSLLDKKLSKYISPELLQVIFLITSWVIMLTFKL